MSEKIAKENWQDFANLWEVGGSWIAQSYIYYNCVEGHIRNQGFVVTRKSFQYDGKKPESMARALNEAKVWCEDWVEENIFKLGRERYVGSILEKVDIGGAEVYDFTEEGHNLATMIVEKTDLTNIPQGDIPESWKETK